MGPAAGAGDAAAALLMNTTEVSSIGNRGGALPDGVGDCSAPAIGEGSGFSEGPTHP